MPLRIPREERTKVRGKVNRFQAKKRDTMGLLCACVSKKVSSR